MRNTYQSLPAEEAVSLARQVYDLYCSQDYRESTMGSWVMTTVYPDLSPEALHNGRDFCEARRPVDARMYLGGALMRGSLPFEPLLKFVENTAAARRVKDDSECAVFA